MGQDSKKIQESKGTKKLPTVVDSFKAHIKVL